MKFAAKRMGATTVEMKSSHVPMLSHPKQVLDVIRTAAAAVQRSAARQGCSAVACRPANRTRCGLRRLAGRGALQRLARARRRRRSERGSETRRLLQRNWGRAAEVSVASFLRWGALPRDARFSALVPHARWRNLLASKRRQPLRPLGRNLHRALHSGTSGGGGIAKRIKWLRLTAKHLKVRAGIRRNTIFPGAQGMEPSRSGRPAT